MHPPAALAGLVCLAVAAGYAVVAVAAVLAWELRRTRESTAALPPVTVLKPLCGAEPGLYAHLRSYCEQEFPEFQIVFGVRDPGDPALVVVEQLVREFPTLPIDVVINPRLHGSNYKISNLINMGAHARHAVLVMADSDTYVGADYLRNVTAPLLDRQVGLVTCLYRDVPTSRLWSRLGAMYINEWYMPSVLVAWLFGHDGYVSGQTLCIRAQTLQAIGGFPAMANHLADDYRMGELVRALGLRVVLSHYLP
ncbi:MAG TPA: bacteriohopanetetrol glucosamine biosynthesis glycosyltransferase HpnI, partial [Steroidobacteraceae bacterium]|nr:bacteriohopanetetrol glucosamine biosynthesis glycosyltransferase HpnI [Steroidobacteraceae bacterium]